MGMKEWAENEVKLACERENPVRKDGEFDYGCACYESALKAFNSLLEDGHSGFSILMTKNILNRMIDGKPLVPIVDTGNIWEYSFSREDGTKVYQCNRMSSFFKSVHPNGEITYSDTNRFCGVNIDNPNLSFHNGLIDRVMSEVYPITMPYMPYDRSIKVFCEDFLTDRKNGDFDTVGILYAIGPDGERKDINRYFKEGEKDFIEISVEEYCKREVLSMKLKGE